jgi:hypothetical protein
MESVTIAALIAYKQGRSGTGGKTNNEVDLSNLYNPPAYQVEIADESVEALSSVMMFITCSLKSHDSQQCRVFGPWFDSVIRGPSPQTVTLCNDRSCTHQV